MDKTVKVQLEETKRVLDIGCSNNKIPGAIGVDMDPATQADILHNLNVYPYPIKENSIDQVFAKHIIEHLDEPRQFLREIYRILKPGGTAFIETPHFTSYAAYAEPQHRLFYSYFMFHELLKGSNFKVLKHQITFHKLFRVLGIRFLVNRWPETYEKFFTYVFPAENVVLLIQRPRK